MTIEDDIAFLERVPALAILGRDALRILAIGSENRYVHEGVSLFGEGEEADGAYVVQEGSFDLVSQQNGAAAATVVGPGRADRRARAGHRDAAPGGGGRTRAVQRGAHSAPAVHEGARKRSERLRCACAMRLPPGSIRPRVNSTECAPRSQARRGASELVR